jgi:hypothetical protein
LATCIPSLDVCGRSNYAGTSAATSGNCLDYHSGPWSQGFKELLRLIQRYSAVDAADHRDACCDRSQTRARLVAKQIEVIRVWADESKLSLRALAGEIRSFG